MKLTRYLILVCLLCPIFAYAQRPLTIVGGVVTANVADTNDFQVILTANVTGVTLVSTTGSANTPVTPATGYQITMRFVQDATGSRTVTFGGNISTACSINSTANSVTICRWQYTASSNTWADAGGSGTTSVSQAPIMGYYLSGDCLTTNLGKCFYTPANTQQANDCAWTATSPTVTCSTSHFVPADTGKRAFGYTTCMASVNLTTNNGNGPILNTGTALTITYVSPTSVTLSSNAANTVTVSAGFPQGGCFIWGTPDDAGAAAMDAAAATATACPRVHLAAAYYMFTVPHFFANPAACAALGVSSGANAGNIVYSAGYELEGRGAGTTVIFLPPGFPETGGCPNGKSGLGCFVIPLQGRWSNLEITGGGNRYAPNMPSTANLIEMDGPASLDYFVCTHFAGRTSAGVGNMVGVAAYLWAQGQQINLSGCGTSELATNTSSSSTFIRLWVENVADFVGINVGSLTDYYAQTVANFSKYNFTCYDCTVSLEGTVGSFAPVLIQNKGLKIKWYRGGMATAILNPNILNVIGYNCATTATCVFDAEDMFADFSGSGSNGYNAINHAVAGTVFLKNSIIKGSNTGFGYKDVAGSVFNNMGGNTIGNTSIVGSLVSDGHSVKGACTGVGTAASTLGLYGTGPNVTLTTCTSAAIGTGTPVSGARTLQNLVVTATAAGTNASSGVVTVLVDGAGSTITCTIGTGTACTDGTHQVAVTDGQRISIQFTTQAADTLAGVKAIVEWN